jgi:hypothetical protein
MESPDLERCPGTLCGLEVAAVVDSNGGRGSESRVFNQRPDKASACCLSSHGWVMKTRFVTAMKITLVLAVVVTAILGSLYLLNILDQEQLTDVGGKILGVLGISTVASFVVIALTSSRHDS